PAALRPLGDVELHQLSLVERPVPLHLDRGEVHEDVLAGGTGDEAVAFVRVEPLNDTAGHELLSLPSPSPSTATNVPGRYQTRRQGQLDPHCDGSLPPPYSAGC